MHTNRPLIISNIRTSQYISLLFLLAMGILLLMFGSDNVRSVFYSDPWIAGPTFLFLLLVFFMLPIWIVLRLKKVELFDNKIVLRYLFKTKKETIPYVNAHSFHTRNVYYPGLKKLAHLRLKNNKKLVLTSAANDNYDACVRLLTRYLEQETKKRNYWTWPNIFY